MDEIYDVVVVGGALTILFGGSACGTSNQRGPVLLLTDRHADRFDPRGAAHLGAPAICHQDATSFKR